MLKKKWRKKCNKKNFLYFKKTTLLINVKRNIRSIPIAKLVTKCEKVEKIRLLEGRARQHNLAPFGYRALIQFARALYKLVLSSITNSQIALQIKVLELTVYYIRYFYVKYVHVFSFRHSLGQSVTDIFESRSGPGCLKKMSKTI